MGFVTDYEKWIPRHLLAREKTRKDLLAILAKLPESEKSAAAVVMKKLDDEDKVLFAMVNNLVNEVTSGSIMEKIEAHISACGRACDKRFVYWRMDEGDIELFFNFDAMGQDDFVVRPFKAVDIFERSPEEFGAFYRAAEDAKARAAIEATFKRKEEEAKAREEGEKAEFLRLKKKFENHPDSAKILELVRGKGTPMSSAEIVELSMKSLDLSEAAARTGLFYLLETNDLVLGDELKLQIPESITSRPRI